MSKRDDADGHVGSRKTGADRAELVRSELRQQPIPARYLTACAWCEDIRVGRRWLRMENVVSRLRGLGWREPLLFTHGICPACFEQLLALRTLTGATTDPAQAA